jgi:hypothetical protein
MAINPYNVPLQIVRNREWIQPFSVSVNGSPLDISRDALALIVLEGAETIVLKNLAPAVSSGSNTCTFVFPDGDTGTLVAAANDYVWQFIRRAYLSANSDLLTAGPLTVLESPPFPSNAG